MVRSPTPSENKKTLDGARKHGGIGGWNLGTLCRDGTLVKAPWLRKGPTHQVGNALV